VKILTYSWKDWFFAIVCLLCIKLLIYIGINEERIYLAMLIGLPVIFISALLYFLIRFKRLENRSKRIATKIDDQIKVLERITKE